jgi:hypothetical protein
MDSKRRVDIAGHLILPFGTATKADINRIHLVRVAAGGVRLESDVPVVHIVKSQKKPLRLADFADVFGEKRHLDFSEDERAGLEFMCAEIKRHNPDMTRHEDRFLDLYFEQIAGRHFSDFYADEKKPGSVYSALMPIPEMQIYVADPLDDDGGYEPNNNFRVDYGFWDGEQLRALEIDGAEPAGYARAARPHASSWWR